MQTAFTTKTAVRQGFSGIRKNSRVHNHTVKAILDSEKLGATTIKAAALASIAALLVASDAPAFAATATAGQGEVLESLLQQQKEGKVAAKTIKAASKADSIAVYGKSKPATAPKPSASKLAAKPKASAKPAVAKSTNSSSKPLKFDSKANSGVQGAAPAGVQLPIPKGAATKPAPAATKPAPAPKKVVAKPSAAATKKEAASKPVAAPAVKEVAKPVAVVKKAEPKSVAPKAVSSTSAVGFSNAGIQAGAVIAAELAGVAIAGAVVGGITKPGKA